jgi:hypothetical protein
MLFDQAIIVAKTISAVMKNLGTMAMNRGLRPNSNLINLKDMQFTAPNYPTMVNWHTTKGTKRQVTNLF